MSSEPLQRVQDDLATVKAALGTELPHDRDKAWYLRPAAVAIVVGIVLLILNIWFA